MTENHGCLHSPGDALDEHQLSPDGLGCFFDPCRAALSFGNTIVVTKATPGVTTFPNMLSPDFMLCLTPFMLSPGHYLFDLTGTLRHTAVISTEATPKSGDIDLSVALSTLSLPPAVTAFFDSVARGETTQPRVVALDDATNATMYPIEWGGERLIALVVTPTDIHRQIGYQVAALLETNRKIHAGRTMEEIFQTLMREAVQILPFDRTSITLFHSETNEVEIYALVDDGSSSVKAGTVVPGENTVTAWVARHGQPIVTPDIQQETRFVVYDNWLEQGFRATLCYPLSVAGQIIGTLNFTSRRLNAYSAATLHLVQPLAEQVAIAIHNVQMRQQLMTESRRLRRIVEVANQVKHHLSLDTGYLGISAILRWICEVACDIGWERALLCLRDTTSLSDNNSSIAAFAGNFTEVQCIELDVLKAQRTAIGSFLTTPGARASGSHRRIGDHSFLIGRNTESPLHLWHSSSQIVVVPLALEGKLFGTLSVDRSRQPPSSEEVEILELLTDHIIVVLHNSRLIEQLQAQLAETQRLREQEQEYHLQMQRTERLRALGELASGVAHNFNNALTVIQGRLELLKRQVKDEATLRSLDIVHKVAQDAANIVKRIQNSARVRRDDSDFERLDLSQLVQETIEVTQPKWASRSAANLVRVTCQAPAPVYVLGHPTELSEVVTNLIFNALDAMPHGGGLFIGVYEHRETAKLVVRDTGTGMTEETKKRLFDPFYTTKGHQGTGLGLSVSYNIVSRHGGRIEVESQLGQGSTFTLTFPLAPPPPLPNLSQTVLRNSDAQTDHLDLPLRSQALRILVIDDERSVAETIGDILTLLGHKPFLEANPATALQQLQRESFDVLFTDLGMPGMNGWQLIAEVRKLSPHLPIVLVTGWADQIHPGDLQSHRMRLVAKPVDVGVIERTLREIANELRLTLH